MVEPISEFIQRLQADVARWKSDLAVVTAAGLHEPRIHYWIKEGERLLSELRGHHA